jgi:hypothetical protein
MSPRASGRVLVRSFCVARARFDIVIQFEGRKMKKRKETAQVEKSA